MERQFGPKVCYNFLTNVQHHTDNFRLPPKYSEIGPGAQESSRDRRFSSLHRGRLGQVSLLFPAGAVGAPGAFSLEIPARI